MPNETIEKLKHDKYVAERKLTAAKHKEKRLESEIKGGGAYALTIAIRQIGWTEPPC